MAKSALAQTFVRAVLGGRRYSRGPVDATAPTSPTLSDPVANTTFIDVAWISGVDAETGVKDTLVEYRRNGTSPWTQTIVAYPTTTYQITGLSTGTPYDIRVATRDNAPTPNVSSYSSIKTVSTLGTSADLEPGTLSAVAASFQAVESADFGIQVQRQGAGVSSPIVEADWSFTGFSEGTPSPANGTLQWASGENSIKQAFATAGTVTVNRVGTFRIVAVRALSGTIQPSLGNAQTSVTIANTASVTYSLFDDFDNALIDTAKWQIEIDGGSNTSVTASTDVALSGTRSKKSVITRNSSADFRAEVREKLGPGSSVFNVDHWYGVAVYLPNSWVSSAGRDILIQWHTYIWLDPADESGTSPCFGVQIRDGNWQIIRRPNPAEPSLGSTQLSFTTTIGPWTKNVWTRWVFRMRWHWTNGQSQVWKDDVEVYNVNGGNCSNDRYAPYWKHGNYRVANKTDAGEPGVSPRVVYHDNARVLLAGGSYAAVRP